MQSRTPRRATQPYGTYLPDGPYENPEHMGKMLAWAETSEDPIYFMLVRLPESRPLGLASYLRIKPEFGVIEIGHIWFGVPLQRTTAATEAIYGVIVTGYSDTAEGVMVEDAEDGGHFIEAVLRPVVTVAEESMVEAAERLHEEASKRCFIASSVNFPVRHEPRIVVGAGAAGD